MIKNNSNVLATYVSPAVKVAQLKTRRALCGSPGHNSEGLKDWRNGSDDIQDEKEDWGY